MLPDVFFPSRFRFPPFARGKNTRLGVHRGGPTASRDSREIAFAFHVYIQKPIEERFPGVSIPLEVQAWVLYCIIAMKQGRSKHFVSGPARGVAKLLPPL